MRTASITVYSDSIEPDRAYRDIRHFEAYPDLVDEVSSVLVRPGADGASSVSDWEVYFRNGPLRWTEIDYFREEQRNIVFEQESGDFHVFRGSWQVRPSGTGSAVTFEATFDFGIPSLAGVLEPIAEKVLKEGIALVLIRLLGNAEVVGDPAVAAAVAKKLAGVGSGALAAGTGH
ncbi:ribosome-associated toxin RatA of RatAB toxin-antitoxin module [Nocardia transvalensis]|uniref:Ribosome-associated toxin RatA of RatAB toxin-antitoxin module n=1 Tax=Nocardia transvalensis TaxID=37333 RepID=A0A7W9PAK8_9NOCA|nr:SRPBCC family protein [Nocardia transvalensis]MBB5912208.1 ribosome-associated toxin RatA of RatAB toxin-antitoxin module [Nocardia transvalensis]